MFTLDVCVCVCVNVTVRRQEWVQTHSVRLCLCFHWRNVKLWRWRWRKRKRKRQVWIYLNCNGMYASNGDDLVLRSATRVQHRITASLLRCMCDFCLKVLIKFNMIIWGQTFSLSLPRHYILSRFRTWFSVFRLCIVKTRMNFYCFLPVPIPWYGSRN